MFGFGGKCLKAMKDNSNSYTAKIRQLSETTKFFLLNETNIKYSPQPYRLVAIGLGAVMIEMIRMIRISYSSTSSQMLKRP